MSCIGDFCITLLAAIFNFFIMHRRQFLAQSSLAVGTLLTSDLTSLLPQDRKLGIALLGLGNYAAKQLGRALQQTEWVRGGAIF